MSTYKILKETGLKLPNTSNAKDLLQVASLDEAGPEAHSAQNPHHTGRRGHFCPDNDHMWICQDCTEFALCTCYLHEIQESPLND